MWGGMVPVEMARGCVGWNSTGGGGQRVHGGRTMPVGLPGGPGGRECRRECGVVERHQWGLPEARDRTESAGGSAEDGTALARGGTLPGGVRVRGC